MFQLLGIGITIIAVFGGFLMMGGKFSVIWQPLELFVIGGAGLGALVLGNSKHVLHELILQLKQLIAKTKQTNEFQRQLLLLMYELLQTAAGGLKALDSHVENPKESPLFQKYPLVLESEKLLNFIIDNFRLMAMGKINSHELEAVLEQELDAIHEELNQPAKSLGKIGEAMPGFGIVAAVLGIVMAMSYVADGATSGEISMKVGAAMVGTFIGIFLCYGLIDPICNFMKHRVSELMVALECVKVVLVNHVSGKPPLFAIDAGRRLLPLNVKPSFAKLEGWLNKME